MVAWPPVLVPSNSVNPSVSVTMVALVAVLVTSKNVAPPLLMIEALAAVLAPAKTVSPPLLAMAEFAAVLVSLEKRFPARVVGDSGVGSHARACKKRFPTRVVGDGGAGGRTGVFKNSYSSAGKQGLISGPGPGPSLPPLSVILALRPCLRFRKRGSSIVGDGGVSGVLLSLSPFPRQRCW